MGCSFSYDTTQFTVALMRISYAINEHPELHPGLIEYIESCDMDYLTEYEVAETDDNIAMLMVKPSTDFNNIVCLAIKRNNIAEGV